MKYYYLNGKIACEINNILPDGVQEITFAKDGSWEDYCQNNDRYKITNGIAEKLPEPEPTLDEAKQVKIAENEQARNVEFITTSLGKLKTETPLGDLKTALPLYEKLAEANNGLPANSVRVYDTQGNVQGSPAMTLTKFKAITLEIAMAYIAIDAKSTAITKAIQEAETLAELEAIEISY